MVVTISMTTAVRIEITVSAGFRMIMVTRVAAMEISELMIWGNALAQQLPQSIHVIGVDRHDIAVGMSIKVFNRQSLHPPEQVVP